jgi:hypothetical protein
MNKKVAVVSVADAEEAARLADLPLEATVALAEVAGAIKDGLLAFASATGFVVMHQMMEAELTEIVGHKHAAKWPARSHQPLIQPKSTIRQQPEHAVATASLQQ